MRLIVRRVKPTPGSQLALFATYSYHGFITDRDGETLELEADHRRHADRERDTRPQVRRRAEPHAVGVLRRQRHLAGVQVPDLVPSRCTNGGSCNPLGDGFAYKLAANLAQLQG